MDLKKTLRLSYWLSFIKFNVVGLSGVMVNEGLLLALVYARVYLLHADAVAIEASILSNFFLNDYWTFRDRRHGHIAVRLVKFNALMIIGLVVNLSILYSLTTYLGINYAVSNLFGIAAAFLLRYWLSVRFTWIKREEASTAPG
ncbi:MAG: GtrA family protein [Nitrososphaerota archaeon]|nr:GtrA family protein [Nitrososphaerota archaeon]MDG6938217.1 GtrA family protein [Nitrososphaerota archaeon]MDG6956266.1 GtrA family protein [Nitrososphaerota archaeon]MDG6959414.1 GtrA family protein [Nitrososphaerota archaeon]MDG7014801.1 GtrA family protein [Nitrososphaerota archaeon]